MLLGQLGPFQSSRLNRPDSPTNVRRCYKALNATRSKLLLVYDAELVEAAPAYE